MTPSTLLEKAVEAALTLGGGGLMGVWLKGVLDARTARATKAIAEPAEFLRAAAEFGEKLSEGGQELLEEFRKEFRFLRGEVVRLTAEGDATKRELEATRDELAASKRGHDDCRREVSALRFELAEALGQLPLTAPILIGRSPDADR